MARYIERSPLTYAKNIVTPLLILHSEDDLRCPIEQAEQLFVALKKPRREVRFVRFPARTTRCRVPAGRAIASSGSATSSSGSRPTSAVPRGDSSRKSSRPPVPGAC